MKVERLFLKGISVLVLVLAFGVVSCDNDPGTGGGGLTVPGVSELPDFPEDKTAATEQNVDAALEAIKNSGLIQDIYGKMGDVISENGDEGSDYTIANETGDDVTVISAKQKIDYTMSKTLEDMMSGLGGLEGLEDMSALNDLMEILFETELTTKDFVRFSLNKNMNGVTTDDVAGETVTVVEGSVVNERQIANGNFSVAKKGLIYAIIPLTQSAEFKLNSSGESQAVAAFTAVTNSGCVKVILDVTYTASASSTKNFTLAEITDEEGDMPIKQVVKYSGSLKVFGDGTTLLKTVTVTDAESYSKALDLIGYPNSLPEDGLDIGGLSPF